MSGLSAPPLAATGRAQTRQREWFAGFRQAVLERGEPYVIADAVAPHEIFHAMGIPVVSIPWYSAVIAAKRLSRHYFDLMDRLGYHDGLPRYSSLPFMTTLEDEPSRAPYGGLPKPMLLLDRLRGDYVQRIAEQWARAFGVPSFALDCSAATELGADWARRGQTDWEALYQAHRLDFQVEQLRGLIRVAETLSHRTFDDIEFTRQMHRVNEAGELVAETRDIIARTVPAPVPLTEQLTNVMAATWHRGSQWTVDHLRSYRDEVQARAESGIGACSTERIRLLWVNNGLWFNTGFYRKFEERYGAVFVWSMYTNFLSDGYRKYFDRDPLRALAARHVSMNEQLHLPPWMAEWIITQARDFGAHGAVMLVPVGDRMSAYGTRFARLALERAGIPVLELQASMVDERLWDDTRMTALVGEFIEERVLAGARVPA
ncbi:MAG: 2-hydroxyacyl-CoA dehydratase [Acetobacteraceae bacterium]|nr:2-hydroxyacyl-CoA dehydratase [Acetobacteraceae bacterium]